MLWRLYDAKNKLSEVVNQALSVGPQRIRRHRDEVVVLSAKDYDALQGKRPGFVEYLMQGKSLTDLDLERDRSPNRDVDL